MPETKNPEGLRLFGVLEIDIAFFLIRHPLEPMPPEALRTMWSAHSDCAATMPPAAKQEVVVRFFQ